jgi:hypothetical protein
MVPCGYMSLADQTEEDVAFALCNFKMDSYYSTCCRQGDSTLSIKSGVVTVFLSDKFCSVILNCIFL